MACISPARLLRPLLWLLWLLLLSLVLPVLLGALTPILLLVWLIGLYPMFTSDEFRERMKVTPAGYLLWALWWPILLVSLTVPALALVFAATFSDAQSPSHFFHLLGELSRQGLAALEVSRRDWARLCAAAGVIAFSSNCVCAFIDIPWRLKQLRQVRALPRSKARSAAIGLAEFEGTARSAGEDPEVSKPGAEEAQPFYLEDETGRILVDPRGAALRAQFVSGASMRLNEIEEGIRDGDRIYVLGNVQPRDAPAPGAADAERLVVRPLRQSLVSSPVGRLLFPKRAHPADREAPNIFIVDKGRERNVILRLRMALWDFCAITAVYVVASLWLVQAAWPWLGR